MSEKYYICSESELDQLVAMALRYQGVGGQTSEANLDYAEAACRAREVPEWATHFWGEKLAEGWDTSGDGDFRLISRKQEIKR